MANMRWKQPLIIDEYVFDDGGHGIKISGSDSIYMGYDALDVYRLLEECLNGNTELAKLAQEFLANGYKLG